MTSFNKQPTLTDGFIRLRPMRAADWPALYAVARDPAIWALHPATDRWQEAVFRGYFDDCLASDGTLVVEDALTGALIGASRFDQARVGEQEIEIGWSFLACDRWGGGTNRAIKRLMVAHALGSFERVIFLIGGTLTARHYDTLMAGQPVRHVIYAIDRAAFAAGPLA